MMVSITHTMLIHPCVESFKRNCFMIKSIKGEPEPSQLINKFHQRKLYYSTDLYWTQLLY
jgi:hypothetical protein